MRPFSVRRRGRPMGTDKAEAPARWHISLSGIVQGVGFRPHVQRAAARLGLGGWVKNAGGALEIEVEGPEAVCEEFTNQVVNGAPGPAQLESLKVDRSLEALGERDFQILHSDDISAAARFIPRDIGICDQCRRELLSAMDRR